MSWAPASSDCESSLRENAENHREQKIGRFESGYGERCAAEWGSPELDQERCENKTGDGPEAEHWLRG